MAYKKYESQEAGHRYLQRDDRHQRSKATSTKQSQTERKKSKKLQALCPLGLPFLEREARAVTKVALCHSTVNHRPQAQGSYRAGCRHRPL